MNRMKKSVKKRWLAALRSGKYKHTARGMYDGGRRFCALGVLIDLEVDGWWVSQTGPYFLEYSRKRSAVDNETAALEALGICEDIQNHLVWLNDMEDSYRQVVSYIEGYL